MAYKMNQKQFDQVIKLPAKEKYIHFIAKVADWEELWTLKSPNGFVLFGDDKNNECIPVWPHPDYASALAKDEWADSSPERLELSSFIDRWIPGIKKDKRKIAVFPTPDEKGIIVEPQKLNDDLSQELSQYD